MPYLRKSGVLRNVNEKIKDVTIYELRGKYIVKKKVHKFFLFPQELTKLSLGTANLYRNKVKHFLCT